MSPKNSWSFLVDENTSRTLVHALQVAEYSAEHVYEVGLQGHLDSSVSHTYITIQLCKVLQA